MNRDNWPKVKEIFDLALARPADERTTFVRDACGGDEALRQEVESLLASYQDAENFMETPAVQFAAKSAAGDGKLAVGQEITRYIILALIGEGGMGHVYSAQDVTLRRKVALKVLPADVAGNAERMRRFRSEATAAAALNHPNIAHIYEVGEDNGVHFIAMEYVDGATLRQLIHERRTELPKLLRFLQHVAEGLSRAHAAGIVHRDLKPDNIMVTRDGHAKILDFGLAKLIESQAFSKVDGDAESFVQHSVPGTVLGTVGYMSPEQAQGKTGEIDQRSDIFSFGCILFEAVTRKKAFAGKDIIDSLNKIIREPAPEGNSGSARQVLPVGRRASVSWTPEGRIVYATEMSGHSDVWIMNADGSMRKQLTSNAEQNIDPSVSPDGRYVAFYSTRTCWGDAGRIDIDGSNPRELTRGLLTWQEAWTPDSKWVLFLNYPDWKIWKVPVDGGTPVPVTDRPAFRPTVSPDGKSLACFYSKSNAEVSTETVYDLAILSLDGTSPPKIFSFRGRRLDTAFALLQWSVDGSAILYNSSVDNVVNIWRQQIAGGEPKQVTDFKDSEISSFAWSRDGRSLALPRGTLVSDAVMISQVK